MRIRETGNERLCAVCAVKRAALAAGAFKSTLDKDDGHFPSTSSIAAATFKRRLLGLDTVQAELQSHLKELKDMGVAQQCDIHCLPALAKLRSGLSPSTRNDLLTFDGDLFYAEALTEQRLKEEYPGAEAEYVDGAANTLRALYRAADARPSKYFAALMMDGDNMGAFFAKATTEQARDLSERVSRFARNDAKQIVERHFGRLIYAGGDDALALLPLDEALPCARELQARFKEAVKDVNPPEDVKLPTPSVGLVIAHHTQPLDATLEAMREAERAAKNDYRRDALCVHVLKRSGEEVRVGTHWKYDDLDAVELTDNVVTAFRDDTLTMKFAHAVAAEARFLVDNDKITFPSEARAAALKRLAKRHSAKGKEAAAENLAIELAAWAEGKHSDDKEQLGLKEVANWILLARFIAGGGGDGE